MQRRVSRPALIKEVPIPPIICERESHKGIVIGKGGQMLKRIGTSARIEIENLMDTKVNLKLWVKVRKEWRDSELYMKNYGYNSKDI